MTALKYRGDDIASGYGWQHRRALFCCLLFLCILAIGASSSTVLGADIRDPIERVNRPIFKFNDALDHSLALPFARAYRASLPTSVRYGVSNFFGNLQELRCTLGGILRGQPREALSHSTRFFINSTFGIGGLLDLGAEMGIEKCAGGFGLTLKHWGVKEGPYLVAPFMAGQSLRDLAGSALDILASPLPYLPETSLRLPFYIVETIDQRAKLLDLEPFLSSGDRYISVRELYIQSRSEETADKPSGEGEDILEDPFSF